MRKTFGGAFALIMVALFTVAPTSPAAAAGGIHLHMAGKVGQKAVGTTIIFGADRFTNILPFLKNSDDPNGCLYLTKSEDGEMDTVWPEPHGWEHSFCGISAQTHNVPASGNLAGSVALPALPAGKYMVNWTVFGPFIGNQSNGTSLNWNFTIGADGTFTAIGPLHQCEESIIGCPPLPPPLGVVGRPSADEGPKMV